MAMAWAVLLPPNQINLSSLLPGFATLFASFVQCNRAVLSRPDCAIVLSCGWPSHHATTHTSCPHAATCHHCRRSGLHALPRVVVCPPRPPPRIRLLLVCVDGSSQRGANESRRTPGAARGP